MRMAGSMPMDVDDSVFTDSAFTDWILEVEKSPTMGK